MTFWFSILYEFYCVIVLSPALRSIFHAPMARYSLFVLKVPLNTNQSTKLFDFRVTLRDAFDTLLSVQQELTQTTAMWGQVTVYSHRSHFGRLEVHTALEKQCRVQRLSTPVTVYPGSLASEWAGFNVPISTLFQRRVFPGSYLHCYSTDSEPCRTIKIRNTKNTV